jgi:hypothetical protein
MPDPYGITAATYRKFAANVNAAIWPDAEIISLANRIKSQAHQRLGLTSEYDPVTQTDKYQAMQQILIDGVTGTILLSLDSPNHQAAGKEKMVKYFSAISDLKAAKREHFSAGADLTTELDPDQYLGDMNVI